LDRAQLKRKLRCSHCGELMATHPYYGPGNIVVDTCFRCHVIWLDYGEMDIVIGAPGRDRAQL
jgi:Zn-finger nucleic acid-binding protein